MFKKHFARPSPGAILSVSLDKPPAWQCCCSHHHVLLGVSTSLVQGIMRANGCSLEDVPRTIKVIRLLRIESNLTVNHTGLR